MCYKYLELSKFEKENKDQLKITEIYTDYQSAKLESDEIGKKWSESLRPEWAIERERDDAVDIVAEKIERLGGSTASHLNLFLTLRRPFFQKLISLFSPRHVPHNVAPSSNGEPDAPAPVMAPPPVLQQVPNNVPARALVSAHAVVVQSLVPQQQVIVRLAQNLLMHIHRPNFRANMSNGRLHRRFLNLGVFQNQAKRRESWQDAHNMSRHEYQSKWRVRWLCFTGQE